MDSREERRKEDLKNALKLKEEWRRDKELKESKEKS